MAARGNGKDNSNSGTQRRSKSSHPEGHFRNKFKYNNTNGRFAVNRVKDGAAPAEVPDKPQISQEELMQHLTAKLRTNKFVEVKTKEMKNDRGTLYEIDVINPGLNHIGNGTFFTMKLHTVSHKSRVIFIRIIFNDHETRNADMLLNADAIIQIFREIAPDTIESVSITDVEDSKGGKHLAVLAETIKGASLNYIYKCAMEFVHVVDEKYGSSGDDGTTASGEDGAVAASAEDMSADQIDAETALLEKKLKALQELKQAKASGQPTQSSQDGGAATASEETQVQPPTTQRPRRPARVSITVGGKTHTFIHGSGKH